MPINKGLEYTVLDMIESATRNSRAMPLNLGGIAGVGGGAGGPPGGFIGRLPQYNVAYDITEAATLDTMPSGQTGSSGWSLVDNLNHIRYRLNTVESGVSSAISGIFIIDDNNSLTYSNIDTVHFSGAGVTVLDLGGGDVRVTISGTGEVEEAPIDGNTYGRNNGTWVIFSGGSSLTVEEEGGFPSISGVNKIIFSGADVLDNYSGIVRVVISERRLHIYNEDLTSQIPSGVLFTNYVYASGTLRLYYNGVRQRYLYDYTQSSTRESFNVTFPTYSGDVIIVDYDYDVSENGARLVDFQSNTIVDSEGYPLGDSLA